MLQVLHELWDFVILFQNSSMIIINIPSGDARLCEKISSESFTWLYNQSLGKELFMGGILCPTDTFLV